MVMMMTAVDVDELASFTQHTYFFFRVLANPTKGTPGKKVHIWIELLCSFHSTIHANAEQALYNTLPSTSSSSSSSSV